MNVEKNQADKYAELERARAELVRAQERYNELLDRLIGGKGDGNDDDYGNDLGFPARRKPKKPLAGPELIQAIEAAKTSKLGATPCYE
jgi:hypothetical protein